LKKIEILAPAGSMESFTAAIHAGADAVYLGGTLFSARASADNFTQEQLLEALDLAHLHGKSVYLTVNTLLKEQELFMLPDYLMPYYLHGLDAVIVQDFGVLQIVGSYFPKLPVHVSTQMTLTGSAGAEFLKNSGYPVTRIVPARELTLSELQRLRTETDLELEVFVHGALCVCYSGQCLLSSMLGGRSGNRGRCAQPCRKLYTAGKHTSYLFSPKDLCTLELIPDLIDAGIDSFKIEGRMKKPEYAAYTAWLYRKYVDRYLESGREEYTAYIALHPQELEDDLRGLGDLYNRGGFTKGYFVVRNGIDMMSMERPNHEGILVGHVQAVKMAAGKKGKGQAGKNTKIWKKAEILWEQPIYAQDVLEIRNGREKVYEYTAGEDCQRADKSLVSLYPNSEVKRGMEVYRTRNNRLLAFIRKKLIGAPLQKGVQGIFSAAVGEPFQLCVKDQEGIEIVVCTEELCQRAQKQPAQEQQIRKLLERTGSTPFYWEGLTIVLAEDIFVPVKAVNELRRNALEAYRKAYCCQFYQEKVTVPRIQGTSVFFNRTHITADSESISRNVTDNKINITAEVLTEEQWLAAINTSGTDSIYARLENIEEQTFWRLAQETVKVQKQCWVSLPRILRAGQREELSELLATLYSAKLCSGVLVHNLEELGFIRAFIKEGASALQNLSVAAGFSTYAVNSAAAYFLREHGCSRLTASVEQNQKELWELFLATPGLSWELPFYGRLPLMVTAQCITSYAGGQSCCACEGGRIIENEYHQDFYSMNFCKYCYNILYSGQTLDLRGRIGVSNRLLNLEAFQCCFIDESGKETSKVLTQARMAADGVCLKKAENAWTGHFDKGMI